MSGEPWDVNECVSPLVFFDGTCGLCHGLVRWIIRYDTTALFLFAPLQGETARSVRETDEGWPESLDSVVLWLPPSTDGPRVRWYSDAVIGIVTYLPWPWSWLRWLAWLPHGVRDPVYRWVARVRFRWFGRREQCELTAGASSHRFLA